MNILLINGSNKPLKNSLLNFFVSQKDFSLVVLVEKNNVINITKDNILSPDMHSKLNFYGIEFLDKTQVSLIVDKLFISYKTFSFIFYIDEDINNNQIDFSIFNIENFRTYLVNELMVKVNFFQVLLEKCKDESMKPSVIVLVPIYAQTKLIKDDIVQSILFSSFHMLTTAIADEFIDSNITCNGILNDDTVAETLEWIIFQNKDSIHGKLFANKQIIDW